MKERSFSGKVHLLGRLTVVLILACFIGLAFVLGAVYHVSFDIPAALQNGIPILLTFTIAGVCENLAYAPMIGCGALYMACVTGNLSNMKTPAAINAMEVSGHAPGTPKGDVISIIAVASSTFVTTLIVFAGMLFLAPLFEPIYNNPFLQPAFKNMMPALFGPLLVPQIAKAPKQAVCPILLAIIVRLAVGPAFFSTYQSFIMIGIIIASVAYSLFMHKKNLL